VRKLNLDFRFFRNLLRYPPIFITLGWALLIGFVLWVDPFWLYKLEGIVTNQLFSLRGKTLPNPNILVVGIDDKSFVTDIYDPKFLAQNPDLALMKNWPFPRQLHGKLLQKLLDSGARVVVFDLLFLNESQFGPEDDESFRKAIEKNLSQVVLGANYIEDAPAEGQLIIKKINQDSPILPENENVKDIIGIVNYFGDPDGYIRRAYPDLGTYYSLDGLAIKKAFPSFDFNESKEVIINFVGPPNSFPVIDYCKLFDPIYEKGDRPLYPGGQKGWSIFKDKIVLVGPKGNFNHDEHPTPFSDKESLMPGVEIHANAISTLLNRNPIRELGYWQRIIYLGLIGAGYALLLFKIESAIHKLFPMVLVGGGYVLFSYILFSKANFLVPNIPIGIFLIGSTSTVVLFQAWIEQVEKRRISKMLHRYVSKNVADELIEKGEDITIPKRRFITILFSDIRDFTTLTENTEPSRLKDQLEEYFNEMVDSVFNHHGTLDKFIGDAIMAVFGSPTSQGKKEDAWNAVQSALEWRDKLVELNKKWAKEGRPPFRIGVGINAGEAMTGEFGSKQKVEFGAIGDSVNVASRVEGLNKGQGTDILITETVYELVSERVEVELKGDILVKGRAQPVKVYALKSVKKV
jgi:adenylate cyclase